MRTEKEKARLRGKRRHWRTDFPVRSMLKLAKQRAARDNIEFDLKEEDITIPEYCPVLGIKLFMGERTQKNNSPSLDKIDASGGYVKGNVEVISWRANRLKSDASLEEVKAIYKYMKRRLT